MSDSSKKSNTSKGKAADCGAAPSAPPYYRPKYIFNQNPMNQMLPPTGMCGPPCISMCPMDCGPPCISMCPMDCGPPCTPMCSTVVTDCSAPGPMCMPSPICGQSGFPGNPMCPRPRRRTIPMPPRPPLKTGTGNNNCSNTVATPRGESNMPPPPAPPPNRNMPPPPAPPLAPQASMEARAGMPQPVADLPPPPLPPELQRMPNNWGGPPPPPGSGSPHLPLELQRMPNNWGGPPPPPPSGPQTMPMPMPQLQPMPMPQPQPMPMPQPQPMPMPQPQPMPMPQPQPVPMYMPMPMPMNPMFMPMNPWFMPFAGGNIPNQTCQITCTPEKKDEKDAGESKSDTKSEKTGKSKGPKGKHGSKKKSKSSKKSKHSKKSPKSKGSKKSKKKRVKEGMLELLRALDEEDSSDDSKSSHPSRESMNEEIVAEKSTPHSRTSLTDRKDESKKLKQKSSVQTSCTILKPTETKIHINRSSCTLPSGQCTPVVPSKHPSNERTSVLGKVASDQSAIQSPHSYKFEITMQETAMEPTTRSSTQTPLELSVRNSTQNHDHVHKSNEPLLQPGRSRSLGFVKSHSPLAIPYMAMKTETPQELSQKSAVQINEKSCHHNYPEVCVQPESDPAEDFEPKVQKWLRTSNPSPLDPVEVDHMNKSVEKVCRHRCHKKTNRSPPTGTNQHNSSGNEHCHHKHKKHEGAKPEPNTVPVEYDAMRQKKHHCHHHHRNHRSSKNGLGHRAALENPSSHSQIKHGNRKAKKCKSRSPFVFPIIINDLNAGFEFWDRHSKSPTKSMASVQGNGIANKKIPSFLEPPSLELGWENQNLPKRPRTSIVIEEQEFESHTFRFFQTTATTSSPSESSGSLSDSEHSCPPPVLRKEK